MVYFREVQQFRQTWLWIIMLVAQTPVATVLYFLISG